MSLTGCYTLVPVSGSTPALGSPVAFDVTDVGRVALGGTMGPEIDRIEGRLVERDNGEYLLSVTSVSLLRGGEQKWSGEQVRLKQDQVGRMYEQRLSKSRTGLAVALGLGATAFIATQGLRAAGSEDQPIDSPDSSRTNRRPGARGIRISLLSFNFF